MHATKDNEKVHKAIVVNLNKIEYRAIYNINKNYLENLEKVFKFLEKQKVRTVYLAIRDHKKTTVKNIDDLSRKYNIELFQTSTQTEKGLQIADFVSWSIFRNLEHGDDKYFNSIKVENIKQ